MTLIVFLILILLTTSDTFQEKKLLQCYKCLRMTCGDHSLESEFCSSLHQFIQKSMKAFYHIESSELPSCPNPIDDDIGWETLKTISPNPLSCPGVCTLGRFQVTSTSEKETTVNYGTVLGCANAELLTNILYTNRRKTKEEQERPCHWENVTSFVRLNEQIENTMALEHCSRLGDICGKKDFCIYPQASLIVPFNDSSGQESSPSFVIWITSIAIFVGVFVLIATFAGMKYGT